ncbi:virulence effector protein, partial [Salmonella enterica subsp. enterica serovar Heidelberg str. 75-3547]
MAIASPTAARPGVTAEEVATIASFWRSCLPSARQHID